MSLRRTVVLCSLLAVGAITGLGYLWSSVKSDTVVRTEYQGTQLEIIKNSATLSIALGINSHGSIIGYKETPNEQGTIFRNVYFHFGSKSGQEMPIPEGFTNVEAAAISDMELVVGHTSRPLNGVSGSLRAVVWDTKSGAIELLPLPEGDTIGQAQDISRDGSMISGYCTGTERMRPVIWQRSDGKQSWTVTVLPTLHEYNPLLMTAQLRLSPSGTYVVGSCTEEIRSDGSPDNALFLWQYINGNWQRSLITHDHLYVQAVNDLGQIVGNISTLEYRLPCVVTLDGKIQLLQLLDGDVSGEARAINSRSEIVGWSDDPHGSEGGPVACQWALDGTVKQLALSQSEFVMVYANNDLGQLAGSVDLPVDQSQAAEEEAKAIPVLAFRTILPK